MDFKIELLFLPVTDVDRSLAFFGQTLGWPVDHDVVVHPELRFVQVTPPGSACSFAFGIGLEALPQGSPQMIQIVVADADEAYAHLVDHGVACTEVDDQPWGRFVTFTDPDDNRFVLQQIVVPGS